MYLDTKGIVTAAVGHAIAKVDDACCLDFHRIDRPATRAEIIADYTNVKYNKRPGTLFLPAEEQDRILAYDLGKFEHILESEFPELYTYPDSAVVAMFDICYNCGSISPAKWPNLTAAIKSKDWTAAAKESARPDVGAERNSNTEQQFLQAA